MTTEPMAFIDLAAQRRRLGKSIEEAMLRGDFEDERERTIALSPLGRPEHEIGFSSGLTPWVTSTDADMSHPSPQQ